MPHPLYLVDAFSHGPFTGNPAGVCILSEGMEDAWMQGVGTEMNQAETAFVLPMAGGFALRWFTPTLEVDLCGHATLASAHVLWEAGVLAPDEEAMFSTRSGILRAWREGLGIAMDFPAEPASEVVAPEGLEDALGKVPVWVGANRMDLLVELAHEDDVRKLSPNLPALGALPYRGFVITAPARDGAHHFVSRFFAPAAGVPEDPVTGSAHCALGPYWSERLGQPEVIGYQASARGGFVGVRVLDDRVELVGRAVTVLQGQLLC